MVALVLEPLTFCGICTAMQFYSDDSLWRVLVVVRMVGLLRPVFAKRAVGDIVVVGFSGSQRSTKAESAGS